ncbi:MAG: hypothetical protein WD066_00085 [Planctomycetaceae bacterium]
MILVALGMLSGWLMDIMTATAALAQEERLVKSGVARTPLLSEQSVTLACKNASYKEFGEILERARDAHGFRLDYPDYDTFKEGFVDPLPEGRVTLDLQDVPFWDAVARISVATGLAIRMGPDDRVLLASSFFTPPPDYWSRIGPMLAVANFLSERDELGRDTDDERKRIVLRFHYFGGEAHFVEMRMQDVALSTRDGQRHEIEFEQDASGVFRSDLPPNVGVDQLAALECKLTAIVARERLVISIHPESTCTEESLGLRARAGAVQETKRLVVPNVGTREPARGYDRFFFSHVTIDWEADATREDAARAKSLYISRVKESDVPFIQGFYEKTPVLEFVRNRRCVADGDGFIKKPSFLMHSAPLGSMEIYLTSEHRDRIDCCHEIILARRGILHETLKIDLTKAP